MRRAFTTLLALILILGGMVLFAEGAVWMWYEFSPQVPLVVKWMWYLFVGGSLGVWYARGVWWLTGKVEGWLS